MPSDSQPCFEIAPNLNSRDAIVNASWQVGDWFEYPVRAQPHHTDYSGVVWHGSYIAWMEEARVECLHSVGVSFADLVALGCNLPVVELAIKYHQSLWMGMRAVVKTRINAQTGVRMYWDHQIQSLDGQVSYVTAQVTLVAVDSQQGKVLRRLPPAIASTLIKLFAPRESP